MRKWMVIGLWFCAIVQAFSAHIDTLQVESLSMGRTVEVRVVVPDKKSRFPVVYLLHGYGGNAGTWLSMVPELIDLAECEGLVLVCPDGKKSWYMDSPKKSDIRYETFMTKELIPYIDSHYPTVNNRKARAIMGLSMGGYGAMFLAIRHSDLYGAAGSTSGGLDICPFPKSWDLPELLGDAVENKKLWETYSPINMIEKLANGRLALVIDCGYDDFFFKVNDLFHQRLVQYGIDHDFYVRPGAHNAAYWKNSIYYQMLFFKRFFAQA